MALFIKETRPFSGDPSLTPPSRMWTLALALAMTLRPLALGFVRRVFARRSFNTVRAKPIRTESTTTTGKMVIPIPTMPPFVSERAVLHTYDVTRQTTDTPIFPASQNMRTFITVLITSLGVRQKVDGVDTRYDAESAIQAC